MDKRIAQNTLNFLLSDRFSFKGTDIPPLLEAINALQREINDGGTPDSQSGSTEE